MTMRTGIEKLRRFTLTMTLAGLAGAIAAMTLPPASLKLSDVCKVDATGNVVVDEVASGRLIHYIDAYFVEDSAGHDILLSQCRKSDCGPFETDLLAGHVGSPVRAEFCAHQGARLTIGGRDVYHLTQPSLDERAATMTRGMKEFGRALIAWCCFWMLVQAIAEIRVNRRNRMNR